MMPPPPELRRRAVLAGAVALAGRPGGSLGAAPAQREVPALLAVEPPGLQPAFSWQGASRLLWSKIFEGLVRVDARGVPHPGLAARWRLDPDGHGGAFELRPGARWHDGTPVTAGDAVFSLALARAAPVAGRFLHTLSARAPDPATLVLRWRAGQAAPFAWLDALVTPIVPAHLFAGVPPAQWPGVAPVGSGPFRLELHRPGELIRLARVDAAPDRPAAIVWHVLTDPPARVRALADGRVALAPADAVPPDAYAGLALRRLGPGAFAATLLRLDLNHRVAPLDQGATRAALSAAIDRAALAGSAWSGLARPASGPFPAGHPFADRSLAPPGYDPEAAAASLDRLGLEPNQDGLRLGLRLLVPAGGPAWAATASLLADQLGLVGVALEVETLEPAAYAARLASWNYDTALVATPSLADPSVGVAPLYLAENIRHVAFANTGGFADPATDTAFADAEWGPAHLRADAFARAQRRLVARTAQLWLLELDAPDLAAAALTGVADPARGLDGNFAALAWTS